MTYSNQLDMGMSCNGVCHRHKALKPLGTSRYLSGQKRCNFCDIFIIWDGLFCPCCNLRLRLAPRSGKYKQKFLNELKEKKSSVLVQN